MTRGYGDTVKRYNVVGGPTGYMNLHGDTDPHLIIRRSGKNFLVFHIDSFAGMIHDDFITEIGEADRILKAYAKEMRLEIEPPE